MPLIRSHNIQVRETGFMMVKIAAGPMSSLDEKNSGNTLKVDNALNDATNIELLVQQLPRERKSVSDESRAISFITLHMYHAEAAAQESNWHVAKFMINKATELIDKSCLAEDVYKFATPKEIEYLCHLCLKIGNQLNKQEMHCEAIEWLRLAHENADGLQDKQSQVFRRLKV
ncbi:hypothetical protein BC936DRAFT_148355 [Jimgerdemannia flammicorona]|uniref:Uncharacterized protein n=1 Tax=Jimgerdemannia flammicorona TaxID=994334 RepID=A0A433DN88_9FUNG|nr:hypothetical protein BC936DRAFT_148355 [Jimgerdemannia flammicorona]